MHAFFGGSVAAQRSRSVALQGAQGREHRARRAGADPVHVEGEGERPRHDPGIDAHLGQVLVVGRAATRVQFEAFWRVTLGPQVLYANAQAVGSHDAPIINGGEVWALKSAENVVIDGPFAPGVALQSFRRVGAAGWASRSMTEASPGRIEPSEGLHGLRLTEWSDASDFHMEFVELAWFP